MGERRTYTLAVLGGTGREGPGLALRWARAGHRVLIGSRWAEKAARVAAGLNARLGANLIVGMTNTEAADRCEVAVLTVPYTAQNAMLASLKPHLQGKVLICVTVAMQPPHITCVHTPSEGSASEQAQAIVGPGVAVVAAFQNISAHHLATPDSPIPCDVLVCGDRRAAKAVAIHLAEDLGTRGLDAGPLINARAVEGLTSILIGINRRYKVKGAGVRITGVEDVCRT